MSSELELLAQTFTTLGLGHEIVERGISIDIGHAKTDFVGLNSVFFEFDENKEFIEFQVIE